jgi:hypothetical protein
MWGKPQVPVYPELGHIPLLIAWPGVAPRTCAALTTTVDLHATLCDVFAVTPEHRTHGHSLVPLLDGRVTSIREWALSGVWGREVHVADATRTFARAPVAANRPLSMYSNRWSTMPIRAFPDVRLPRPDARARLEPAPGTTVPVMRQPFDASDRLPFWAVGAFGGDVLYDRFEPQNQTTSGAAEMTELLVEALRSIEAPGEQMARLGIG